MVYCVCTNNKAIYVQANLLTDLHSVAAVTDGLILNQITDVTDTVEFSKDSRLRNASRGAQGW